MDVNNDVKVDDDVNEIVDGDENMVGDVEVNMYVDVDMDMDGDEHSHTHFEFMIIFLILFNLQGCHLHLLPSLR